MNDPPKIGIPWEEDFGDEWEFSDLARYNAERARGIVHTPEWRARMAHQQERFDWKQRRAAGIPTEHLGPPPPRVLILPAEDKLRTEPEWRPFFHWAMIPVAFAAFFVGAIVALVLL